MVSNKIQSIKKRIEKAEWWGVTEKFNIHINELSTHDRVLFDHIKMILEEWDSDCICEYKDTNTYAEDAFIIWSFLQENCSDEELYNYLVNYMQEFKEVLPEELDKDDTGTWMSKEQVDIKISACRDVVDKIIKVALSTT